MGGGVIFEPFRARIMGVRWLGDREALKRSASGGVFYALAKNVIEEGGHVFGAAFDDELTVRHIEATNMQDVVRMQNSKYVQSDLGDVFPRVRDLLARPDVPAVLFSGTPCQCAGLKSFLGERVSDKLLLVDFVCHGVPSPLLFKKYLLWKEHRIGHKLTEFDFRTKERVGWNFNGYMSAYMRFDKRIRPNVLDPYMTNFLMAADYAEACYKCEFATKRKAADITLGDFAGAREQYPHFFSKEGCSIVLTPTRKGEDYLNRILECCETIDVDFSKIEPYAPCLTRPCARPSLRNKIYEGILEMDADTFIRQRLPVHDDMKRMIKFYLPYGIRQRLKGSRVRK